MIQADTRTIPWTLWVSTYLEKGIQTSYSGPGRVFSGSGISLKNGVGFGSSREAGFAKIGHGMWDSNIKRKWDARFSKKKRECRIRTPLPDPGYCVIFIIIVILKVVVSLSDKPFIFKFFLFQWYAMTC